MVSKDDLFHLATYQAANYCSINWLWDSNPSAMGAPPGFAWARWVRDEAQMPPRGDEAQYMAQLIALSLADEWDLNDPAVRDRAVKWFNAVRDQFPNTILYTNNYGGQVSDAALGEFISRAKPDMIMFDTYPFRAQWDASKPNHTGAALPAQTTPWYSELRRYRDHALASGIPFGTYIQTFHAVQDYDQTNYRDPSASELRLNHFAALAFNAKYLTGFTYNTGASSLFTRPGGDSNPTPLYAEQANINRRVRNLGRTLVRLKPIAEATHQYTTSMMFIRGRHRDAVSGEDRPNPLPIGFVPDPQAPDACSEWVADRNDPYLRGWAVNNLGTKNHGLPGDVIVSWFTVLDESLDGPGHRDQVYLMVVNGLSDPGGSAADCRQQIKLNFAFSGTIAGVQLMDPDTGQIQRHVLPVVNGRRQLTLTLDGGDAALFKFDTGAPFVMPEPASATR